MPFSSSASVYATCTNFFPYTPVSRLHHWTVLLALPAVAIVATTIVYRLIPHRGVYYDGGKFSDFTSLYNLAQLLTVEGFPLLSASFVTGNESFVKYPIQHLHCFRMFPCSRGTTGSHGSVIYTVKHRFLLLVAEKGLEPSYVWL